MKKLLATLLVLVMALSLVPMASAESDEPVVLNLFYRRSDEMTPSIELIHQWVIDNLGIDMQVIPGSDNWQQELLALIAGGTVPDIMAFMNSTMFNSYAADGVFYDLTDKLADKEAYPGIYRYLNSVYGYTDEQALDRVSLDGRVYGLPSLTIARSYYSNNIRTDWLEKLNLEMPTTLDEFRAVMEAFTYNDPDGDGQDDTYGFNARKGYLYFTPFFGAFGTRPDEAYSLNENGEVVTGVLSENYRAALTWLHEAYEDGLIDPESFTQSTTEWNEKWARDEFGFTCGWWEAAGNVIPYGFTGTLDVIYPPVGENGVSGVIAQDPVENYMAIGHSTEHIDECLKLVDFLMSDYGHRTLMTGIEGLHWTYNDDKTAFGWLYTQDPERKDKEGNVTSGLMQYYRFVYDIGIENETFAMTEGDYRYELLAEGCDNYREIPVIDNLFIGLNTEELTTYGSDLSTYIKESGAKFITGELSIENDWASYANTYLSMGGEQVRESLLKAYNDRNGTELVFAADAE